MTCKLLQGVIAYNNTVAVLITEIFKLLVTTSLAFSRGEMANKKNSISWRQWFKVTHASEFIRHAYVFC
jgi:hypothetical protein